MDCSSVWTTTGFPTKAHRQVSARVLAQVIDLEPDNEGICDGFRSPDEVIARKRDSIADPSYEFGDVFGLGSSVTSNFWLVPLPDLEQALETVDKAVLAALPAGLNPVGGDACLTGVWLDDAAPDALVGCIASGDWAATLDAHFHEAGAYDWDRATWLAFGGADNGPQMLLEACSDEGKTLPSSTLDLLYGSVVQSIANEVAGQWQEDHPDVLAGWSPTSRAAPVSNKGQSPG